FFFLSSILVLYFLSIKISKEISEDNKYFFPLAAFSFALQTHAQIYATGGLETSFFGFLILLGYTLLLWKEEYSFLFWGNFVLILASLTRPEGILFALFGILYVVIFKLKNQPNNVSKSRFFFAVFPFICIYLPYLLWKFEYYGNIFPNTFIAKYNNNNSLEQGLKYTFLYFNSYYVFYFFILFLIIFVLKVIKIIQKINKEKRILRRRLASVSYRDQFEIPTQPISFVDYPKIFEILFLFLLPSLIYISYLTYIGGDFMFARLLISMSPILFFSQEALWLFTTKERLRLVIGVLIVVLTVLYYNPYRGLKLPIINNITSENDIYKLKDIYALKQILLPLQKLVKESDLRVAFGGAQAMMVYYLNPEYALETEAGLTDPYIAKLPPREDTKIGHGKKIPKSYLRKKKIHIHLNPAAIPKTDYNGIRIIGLPHIFRIVVYEKKVFDILESSGKFEFIPFDEYLDNYISKIKTKKIERIRKDYFKFRKYYFKWNSDPKREKFFTGDTT
ncbi:MAG: hypothetical protein N3A69_06170, partial [Leptospiraceae bacterium]|nr:hypothetical protein [Leptospiraceae bacterium]